MGCFGGIINYILVDDRKKIEKLEILKSIFLGVGASFLVNVIKLVKKQNTGNLKI